MEKQRIKRTIKSGKRLLIRPVLVCAILLAVCQTTAFSQSFSAIQGQQNLLPVEDQKLYSKQDIKYEILIPKARSSNVQLQSQNLPGGVELKTVRKSDYYTDESGTLIELWYRFEKKGVYHLPRLAIYINGHRRYFTFSPIQIEEDPANRLPRIVIEFENGTTIYSDDPIPSKPILTQEVGTKIQFRINLQYSTQLVHFNWEIPQDSIFKQIQTYEFTEIKYREKKYTNELIPIADFEWTSLAPGQASLPKIRLTATAYKGYRTDLIMPNCTIEFVQPKNSHEVEENTDDYFDAAFNEAFDFSNNSSKNIISEEMCQKIADLRIKERNLPFSSAAVRKERQELEASLGLPSDIAEFNLGILYFFSILTLIFTVLLLILLKKKKSIAVVLTAVLLTCSLAMCAFSAAKSSRKNAICKGCMLYSIPEQNANSNSEIASGNRVTILEQTDSWYFIELGTISGWCKKDQLIMIK